MTKDQKVIRAKVGLLELARQLGNVSQACKMMGHTLMRRRHEEFAFTSKRIALSKAVICSLSCRQATSIGRTISATSERPASKASTFRSNGDPRIPPGRRPKVLRTPRMWLDNLVLIPTSCALAPRIARARWLSSDLT